MRIPWRVRESWARFWMTFSGKGPIGRAACSTAAMLWAPHLGRLPLRHMSRNGFISLFAKIWHEQLVLGANVFVGDRAVIFQDEGGGPVKVADQAILRDGVILETGQGGSIEIGEGSSCNIGCYLSAYISSIQIGRQVRLAPGCRLYAHNHGRPGEYFKLSSKGPIIIEDEVWLAADVKVLSGVRIGRGAMVATASVVTRDIPAGVIAAGIPAKPVKSR